MSLSVVPVESKKINNTVLNVDQKVYQGILEASPSITYREFDASSDSISSSNYTMQIPRRVILDRKPMLKSTWQIVFTGTSTTSKLLNDGYDSLRPFPASRAQDTTKFTLNGNSFSANISEYIDDLLRYENLDDLSAMSTCPVMMEQSQNYADLAGANMRNPLNGYKDSNGFLGMPRGAFALDSYTDNGTTATVVFTTVEPFFMSPWLHGTQESKGLYNLQEVNVNINWNANLSACMWSHASGLSTISNMAFTLVESSILCRTLNPNSLQLLPEVQQIDYVSFQVRSSDVNQVLNAGQSVTNNTQNITFKSIPSGLILSVKEKRNDRSYLNPLNYASIEKVSIYWQNQEGNLSGCTKEQLYSINKRNGLNMSYNEWSGNLMNLGAGSQISGSCGPLLLKFGSDIPISGAGDLTVSSGGSYDCQVTVTYTNRSNRNINYSIYLIPIYEGISTIYADQMITMVGQVSAQEVIEVMTSGADGVDENNLGAGGNIFRSFTDKLRKYVTVPNIRKARALAQKAVKPFEANPYGQAVSSALNTLESIGLGEGGQVAPKRQAPKKKPAPKKRAKAGVLLGGKPMSREEMKRRLGY